MRSAAGQKPPENIYRQAVQAAYDSKAPVAIELGRQWIAAYPSNDSWKNGILIYRQIATPDVESTLDLMRLLQGVGALSTSGDYNLFASAAADQLNFVEAQSVLNAGIAAGKVDPASPQFRDLVSGLKAKQKPTAADLAVAMKAAANTKALIRIGDSYAALGDNAKAIEAYRTALGKPDVDAAVANIHLGIALARSGDKAGAKAAFEAVTGPRAEVAKYWLLYLQTHA
jgi:tetratricopeptide (TPR) repeat protein